MMKFIYIIIFSFIGTGLYAQERFFTFTERWMASSALEFDDHYAIIGTGSIDNDNHITITRISKVGEHIDNQHIPVNNTIESEILYQQALSCYNQQKVMGVTVINESESLVKARRLFLNNDLSIVIDSSWQYVSPEGEEAIMFITHQTQANTIIHGLNYYTGSVVKSTLLSTDTLGNVIWESNFACGAYCWMEPRHIHPAHDGGYIITHTEQRNSNNGPGIDDHDVVNIIKTDSLGAEQWRIHPGGEGDPYTSNHIVLQPTDDGNYLCVWADNFWKTSSVGHYNFNPDATIWLAKIAPNGNKIWEKNIQEQIDEWGVDAGGYAMRQMIRTSDGNFAITVNWGIFKINQEGDIIWARYYNPSNIEPSYEQIFYYRIYGINETSDEGFMLTGEFEAYPGTDFSEYIQTGFALKVDEYGCLEAGCQEDDPIVSVEVPVLSEHKLLIYPNPANDYVTIDYTVSKSDAADLSIIITDILGKEVHQEKLSYSQDEIVISTNRLPQGQYFCMLKSGNNILNTNKIILIK